MLYLEQSLNEPSPPGPNTPIVLDSTEMSGNNTREMITQSSISSPGPQIATIDSDSKETRMPNGFRRQLPINPPNLNDLNMPPKPFKIVATMAEAKLTAEGHDKKYRPLSSERRNRH